MTHTEVFNTIQQAKQFKKLSLQSVFIPNTICQHENICILESIDTSTQFEKLPPIKQRKVLSDILNALKWAIKHNIYHLDLKKEHIAIPKNTGILLDWNDAVFLRTNTIPNIASTYPPSNSIKILEQPSEKTLLNGIISQFGFLLYKFNIFPSKYIYKNPSDVQFTQLYNILNI